MAQAELHAQASQQAREERSRMLDVMRKLEDGLAAASTTRERRWVERVNDILLELRDVLKETRESADARGSLLDQLVDEYPRLHGRAQRLRAEYDKVQQLIQTLVQSIDSDNVETVRQQLGSLLTKLRTAQAQETELIFEAFHVDIGVGD
jgi:uncharacterized coiled-coil DUF342 family protein